MENSVQTDVLLMGFSKCFQQIQSQSSYTQAKLLQDTE
jgi:hypothetical protein